MIQKGWRGGPTWGLGYSVDGIPRELDMDMPFGESSQEMPAPRRQAGFFEVSQALVLSTLAVTTLPFFGSAQDSPTIQPRAQQLARRSTPSQ